MQCIQDWKGDSWEDAAGEQGSKKTNYMAISRYEKDWNLSEDGTLLMKTSKELSPFSVQTISSGHGTTEMLLKNIPPLNLWFAFSVEHKTLKDSIRK